MTLDFSISPLHVADWPQVRAIYLQGIATGLATFETTAPDWERWNAAHHPFARLAARADGRLLGWVALSPVSTRTVYAGVADVSIYVAEDARGQGVGRALLQALIPAAEASGIWTLQSSIFAENQASLALHQGDHPNGSGCSGHAQQVG